MDGVLQQTYNDSFCSCVLERHQQCWTLHVLVSITRSFTISFWFPNQCLKLRTPRFSMNLKAAGKVPHISISIVQLAFYSPHKTFLPRQYDVRANASTGPSELCHDCNITQSIIHCLPRPFRNSNHRGAKVCDILILVSLIQMRLSWRCVSRFVFSILQLCQGMWQLSKMLCTCEVSPLEPGNKVCTAGQAKTASSFLQRNWSQARLCRTPMRLRSWIEWRPRTFEFRKWQKIRPQSLSWLRFCGPSQAICSTRAKAQAVAKTRQGDIGRAVVDRGLSSHCSQGEIWCPNSADVFMHWKLISVLLSTGGALCRIWARKLGCLEVTNLDGFEQK